MDNLIEGIPELPAVLQSTGKSETAVMSQKAVTEAILNCDANTQKLLENLVSDVSCAEGILPIANGAVRVLHRLRMQFPI